MCQLTQVDLYNAHTMIVVLLCIVVIVVCVFSALWDIEMGQQT